MSAVSPCPDLEPWMWRTLLARAVVFHATLLHSPFGSDTTLIGRVAHVFPELAGLDGTVLPRTEVARSQLLRLAKAPVWPTRRPEGKS